MLTKDLTGFLFQNVDFLTLKTTVFSVLVTLYIFFFYIMAVVSVKVLRLSIE